MTELPRGTVLPKQTLQCGSSKSHLSLLLNRVRRRLTKYWRSHCSNSIGIMASNNINNLNDNQPELAGAGPPEPPVPVPVPPPPPPNDAMMVLKASLVDSKDEDSIARLVM